MARPFSPGDRVYVTKRNQPATVETVRLVELDLCVVYDGEGAPDSFNGPPVKREFVGWDAVAVVTEAADSPALDEGDEITVAWGEEKYAPRPYMNFTVGPLFAKTKVRPGETAEEAHERVWIYLDTQARKQFNTKRNQFLINLQEL